MENVKRKTHVISSNYKNTLLMLIGIPEKWVDVYTIEQTHTKIKKSLPNQYYERKESVGKN